VPEIVVKQGFVKDETITRPCLTQGMRRLANTLLIIVLLVFASSLAQAFALSEGEWDLTTDLKIESLHWPSRYGEGTNDFLNRLQLIPTLSGKYAESGRIFFKPEFFSDPQNNSPEERIFVNLGEAYFKYKTPDSSIQVGSHIVNWGVTDGYNPLDVVNPRQFYDPLRAKKLGVLSLLLSHNSETSEQDLIYIPKTQASMLPGTNSRWLPREIYIPRSTDNNVTLLLPENIHYTYGNKTTLNDAFDHNLGLRLQWHLGDIDLGITGFDGANSFPLVQPEVSGVVLQVSPQVIIQTDPNIILHLKYYRQRQAGFSWVSSQKGFLFKYATSYSQSQGEDPLLPGWSHSQVAALERNFHFGKDGLLVAVLQYSVIRDQKEDNTNLSVADIFRRAWMLGGRFTWNEVWTFHALGLYDTLKYTHYQDFALTRRLWDQWTAEVGVMFIEGASDTPLGIYNKNDHSRFSIGTSF